MNEPPKDYDKSLDLHESEWSKDGKKQPILGAGAGYFLNVTLPVLALGIVLMFISRFIYRAILGY